MLMISSCTRRSCARRLNLSVRADVVTTWHIQNDLLQNPIKTEALVTGTRQQITEIDKSAGIMLVGASVPFVNKILVLGVTIDSELSFDDHITSVECRTSLQLPYPNYVSHSLRSQPRCGQYDRMLNSVLETGRRPTSLAFSTSKTV